MNKVKLGIFGPSGKMGQNIISQLEKFDNDLLLSSLCEQKNHEAIGKKIRGITVLDCLETFISNCEVIIDFSSPDATLALMEKLDDKKASLVTGTTGFSVQQLETFYKLSNGLTLLQSFNMSMGVNILLDIVEKVSSKIPEVDIEISEVHHKYKKDAPSGTAISIGESVKKGRKKFEETSYVYRGVEQNKVRNKGDIGFTSLRGGDVIGEHSVFYFMNGEQIEIKHKATNRKIFSLGALHAAVWIRNKGPGLYSMKDVLK